MSQTQIKQCLPELQIEQEAADVEAFEKLGAHRCAQYFLARCPGRAREAETGIIVPVKEP